jgi:hypothetical protein
LTSWRSVNGSATAESAVLQLCHRNLAQTSTGQILERLAAFRQGFDGIVGFILSLKNLCLFSQSGGGKLKKS